MRRRHDVSRLETRVVLIYYNNIRIHHDVFMFFFRGSVRSYNITMTSPPCRYDEKRDGRVQLYSHRRWFKIGLTLTFF